MKLHELQPSEGSRQKRKRVGRGTGSGMGKTATRGHKGQNSRSGGGVRPGFEGGQTPLARRLPKRGFTNPSRKEIVALDVAILNRFADGTVVTPEFLKEQGVIKNMRDGVKFLGTGDITVKVQVKAHAFSQSAADKIASAGGTTEVI
ncbi:50S ribosomal protein L15 [Desulfuribacillus stibiiarsenatis]|uniref:Large ribosomal subunit protein uL15 n=1 Tax=Desulfuribacillus stibiiarsenatis TaxID=1390249 RepID=A0A1E5L880_9FIRM|nr:50S ribosomal protein L15 [Desulfuribacillus stibiiarsenatis]OEH86345.1 50S ribosomal protein L15 [Desulfuribacillus stibiiarsenatis]